MFQAILFALLPVALVGAVVIGDLRPSWHDYQRIPSLPERAVHSERIPRLEK
jgi:hypothetical protein